MRPRPVGGVAMEVQDNSLAVISEQVLVVLVSVGLEIIGGGEDVPHPNLDVIVDIDVEIPGVGEITAAVGVIKVYHSRPSTKEAKHTIYYIKSVMKRT